MLTSGRVAGGVVKISSMASPLSPFGAASNDTPLSLTFDGRTLGDVDAARRDATRFLLELTAAPTVDAIVLDAAAGLVITATHAEVLAPDLDQDTRTISYAGQPHRFLGVIPMWSSHVRRAELFGVADADRDWFDYYEAATSWHERVKRHFYVTGDRKLLAEVRASATAPRWRERRIIDVVQALRYLGLVMISRDVLYVEAHAGYLRNRAAYDMYFEVAVALTPSRARLSQWLAANTEHPEHDELQGLIESLFARAQDLLRARDQVALIGLRAMHDWATVDQALYHFRAAMLTVSAIMDTIAGFAQRVRCIEGIPDSRVALHQKEFRRAVKAAGLNRLAEDAGQLGKYWSGLGALRNAIAHAPGIAGTVLRVVPGPATAKIRLSAEQASLLKNAAHDRKAAPLAWGLEVDVKPEPLLDPPRFLSAFLPDALAVADQLIDALASDLGAPARPDTARSSGNDLTKFAHLAGVALPPGPDARWPARSAGG